MFNLRLYSVCAILVTALLFLQYRLWFEPNGIQDMKRLRQAIAVQSNENDKLKKENEILLSQIQRLHNSEATAESRARNELGMIKKGEKFYQIVH